MRCFYFFALVTVLAIAPTARAERQWLTMPETPMLPDPDHSGYAPVNGIKIWYAEFGRGEPVILLHGGLANANYWGNQVPALTRSYHVIVMDSRGHGRSTRDERPFGYDLMASDVIALMDQGGNRRMERWRNPGIGHCHASPGPNNKALCIRRQF